MKNEKKRTICKWDSILTNDLPDFKLISSTVIASQNYDINTLI